MYSAASKGTSIAQELCESRGGRPGLPVPGGLYCFCGRKATFKEEGHKQRAGASACGVGPFSQAGCVSKTRRVPVRVSVFGVPYTLQRLLFAFGSGETTKSARSSSSFLVLR